MAYLKPKQTVFFANNGRPIHSLIEKVAFRKYWGKKRDKATGKMKRARKSMPYAICKVMLSSDPAVPVGAEFTIAGYMLSHVVMDNERILTFNQKYVADFADQYGNEWVRKMITEEYWKDNKDESR